MATITLEYDGRNKGALSMLKALLDIGLFKVKTEKNTMSECKEISDTMKKKIDKAVLDECVGRVKSFNSMVEMREYIETL